MVRVLYCSADGGRLQILSLVNSFYDGLCAVLLRRWQCIAHSSACQRLFRQFAHCIAHRLAVHCLFLHSLTAFQKVCALYLSADGGGLLILTLVNGFHDGLHTVLRSGWQRIAPTCTHQRLS